MTKDISFELTKISVALRKVTDGWCVTNETPQETREWIGRLHLEAERAARKIEEINDCISGYSK